MYDFDTEISRREYSSLKWDVGEGELPMWVADMDFAAAPCIRSALERRVSHGVFGYSVMPESWYDAYIGWWKSRHGLTIKKDELIFATGIVPAISSIVNRVTNVGDNVAVLTPVYNIFFHSIENFGRHTLECRLSYDGSSYSLDFDALEKALSDKLTTLLILCNPHNPVGKIWTRDELSKIARLAEKYGVTVLSDEIHCDIVRPGTHYTPFLQVSGNCKAIMCVSASKAFNIAGLQSAAVIVPDPVLRSAVERGLNSNEVAEPNCFAADATAAALTKGQDWLDEMNAYVWANKTLCREFIDGIPSLKLNLSDATYLLWIDCGAVTDDSASLARLIRKRTGLVLSDGAQYRGNGRRFLRMNIACPRSRVLDGLDRLKRSLTDL